MHVFAKSVRRWYLLKDPASFTYPKIATKAWMRQTRGKPAKLQGKGSEIVEVRTLLHFWQSATPAPTVHVSTVSAIEASFRREGTAPRQQN